MAGDSRGHFQAWHLRLGPHSASWGKGTWISGTGLAEAACVQVPGREYHVAKGRSLRGDDYPTGPDPALARPLNPSLPPSHNGQAGIYQHPREG